MSYNGRRVRERSSRSSLFSCGLEMITQTTTYTHVTSSHTLRTTKDITSDLVIVAQGPVQGPRPRRRPKKTWWKVVKEDCQARKLNTEDAMDRHKWRKLIKDVQWSGWVWVGECFFWFWYRPTRLTWADSLLNGCVCVCVCVCVTSVSVQHPAHSQVWFSSSPLQSTLVALTTSWLANGNCKSDISTVHQNLCEVM